MKSSGALPSSPSIVALGVWVYQTSVAQQASQFIGLTDGTLTNRSMLGSDITGAGGKGTAVQANATPSNSQALTDVAGTANAWVLYVAAFLSYPNNQIVWMAGGHKGTKNAIVNPSGLNTLQLGGRGTQTEAHAFTLTRGPTDLEVAALAALVNPRALGLSNYYYVNSTGGTENDLIGGLNLTVTGTTAGSVGDPQIATWFIGTAIPNQSWTQGAAITAIDLTTKFDNGAAATAPWTGSLKQLGSAGTATTTNGAATTASTQLTTAAPLTAGQWVKVGTNAPTPVLYASGNTALLQTALTWANGDTVTPYPVQALTAITSNGVTVNGSNQLTGTPGAGAVGTFNNCLIQATNNSSGAVAYSGLFNIAVASSGAAPSFTSGPSLTSANTDGYTYGATSNQTGTWHLGVYLKGSSVPSTANLKAGAGTGFVAHFTQSVTAATPASLSATGLTFPFYDVHQLVTSGSGDSAIVSNLAVFKAAPSGKQYVPVVLTTITSITKANPAVIGFSAAHGRSSGDWTEVFDVGGMTQINGSWGQCTVVDSTHLSVPVDSTGFSNFTSGGKVTWGRSSFAGSSTAVVSGDVLVADLTDGQGNGVTFTAEGVAIFATNSLLRQSFVKDVYSVSLGNFIGSATEYENDSPPTPPGQVGLLPSLLFPLNQQSSLSVANYFPDPQGDAPLTITALTSLPTGRTISGENLTGIATVPGVITTVTFQAQNNSTEFSQAQINIIDGGISVPAASALNRDDAEALIEGVYLIAQFGDQDDPNPAGPAIKGTVIGQTPLPGAIVAPGTTVNLAVSTGNAPPSTPVEPPTTVVDSPTIQYEESANTVNNYRADEGFGQVVMGPDDQPGQKYRICRVSAAGRISELEVEHDANPSGSQYVIGVHLPNGCGEVVPGSSSLLVSSLTLDEARPNWTEVYSPHVIGGTSGLANVGKRVWELLGMSADPSPPTKDLYYDVVVVAITPGTAGGYLNVRLSGRLITSLRVP